jgi:hypothetical protein
MLLLSPPIIATFPFEAAIINDIFLKCRPCTLKHETEMKPLKHPEIQSSFDKSARSFMMCYFSMDKAS